MKNLSVTLFAVLFVATGIATNALAQTKTKAATTKSESTDAPATPAQVVVLDECDPTTFNAALGPNFCHNVSLAPLGFATTLSDLFAKAAAGTPDPNWDFEPDQMTIKKGTPVVAVDQGGEPHTFTEVAEFGGGFIPGLN